MTEADIAVLFKNDDLLVVNKPAGLPVHAGPGGGLTLDDFVHAWQFDKKTPPSLAHRLDRDTSGCLILGRTKAALRILGRLFEQGRVQKTYWAILHGVPPSKYLRIDAPLAKITAQKHRWHMRIDANGQTAITELRVLAEKNGYAWVELKPKTGRTHQLRVHCAAQNCPILGDGLYGRGDDSVPLMLHARSLRIPYLQGAPAIVVDAPVNPAMRRQMDALHFTLPSDPSPGQ